VNAARFTVRAAADDDVPALLRMIRALAEYERLSHLVVATEEGLRRALFEERGGPEALIAYETGGNSNPAGFALFFHTFSTFLGRRGLWLEDVFVYPDQRGKGLGRQLLSELAAIARARNCGRFEWTVLDWNTDAIGFYDRMGATMLPEWRIVRVTGDALRFFGADMPADPDRQP
jgi:GNAT superfamily N-acetyltransferase